MPLFLNWVSFGVLLMILELLLPGTYLIWFGFASLVMGGITYFFPDIGLMYQLIWVSFLSFSFALIGWKIYGKLIFKGVSEQYKNLNDPIAQLVGKVVTIADVKDGKYQVSVGDTVWSAISDDTFKKGEKAVISGSYNNVELKIKKLLDKKEKKE